MGASVRLVGRVRVAVAIVAAALVCAGSRGPRRASPTTQEVTITGVGRRRSSPARSSFRAGTPPGRRLAGRHPLPRARPGTHRTWRRSATRLRHRRLRLARCATPAAPARRAAVRARRADRGPGRAGPLQLVRRAERRLGHPDRRVRPLSRRRRGLERGRRRRPVQGDRARRSRGRASGRHSTRTACRRRRWSRALPGRLRSAGTRAHPGTERPAQRQRDRAVKTPRPRAPRARSSTRSPCRRSAAGPARLPLRPGSGDRGVQAARRAEAALPRRPRPCAREEPGAEQSTYLAEAVALVRAVPRRRTGASRGGVELAHDPWDGTTSVTRALPRTRRVSVNLPGDATLATKQRERRCASRAAARDVR